MYSDNFPPSSNSIFLVNQGSEDLLKTAMKKVEFSTSAHANI